MAPLHILVFWSVTASLSTCSPFLGLNSHSGLGARQTVNCQDIGAQLDSSCWATLDIPNYLTHQNNGWIHTTPTCASGQDDSACCQNGEAWSTCFLRLATATSGQDCTQVGSQSCVYSGQLDPNLSPSIRAQVHYVAYNIYQMYDIFSSTYQVLNSVQQQVHQTTLNVASTLGVSAKPGDTIGPSSDVLNTAISSGVVFLGSLTAGEVPGGSNSPSYTAAKAFVQSVRQTPSVAKAMWPNGGGDLDGLSQGLQLVMADVSSFIEFANNGTYSGPQLAGNSLLGGNPDLFADAANTYSTSELLQTNGFYAVPGKVIRRPTTGCTTFGVTGEAFAGLLCTATDGSRTVSYWSAITGRTYEFVYKGQNGLSPAGVLKSIATQSQANVPVLFDGAYECTFEGKAGSNIAFNDDDGLPDTNCLSVLPMYLQCGTDCPQGATQVDNKCPFGYERKCAKSEDLN